MWLKAGAEKSFLHDNHVNKAALARITDGIPQYGGVVVFNIDDVPLGFGAAAQPSEYCRDLEPDAMVVLDQANIGKKHAKDPKGNGYLPIVGAIAVGGVVGVVGFAAVPFIATATLSGAGFTATGMLIVNRIHIINLCS